MYFKICSMQYSRCFLSCLASGLLIISVGMIIAYPSPAFPDINHGHYGFKMSIDVMSWLASFAGLFAIPGSVLLVPVMDRFGRKFALIMCTIPLALGWLLTLSANSVLMFAVGRAILGTVLGMVYACIPLYLSEIAPKEIRGSLGSGLAVFAYMGGLLTNILGTFINFRWLALFALAMTAASSLATFFMFETPRWLMTKGYREAAADVLSRSRKLKDPLVINQEVEDIAATLKNVTRLGFMDGLSALIRPPLLKPFIITQLLMIFQQFTGAAYIHSYTVTIFLQATEHMQTDSVVLKNPHYQASIAIGVFVVGSIVAVFVIDRLGRRILLLASGTSLTLAMALLGAYYYILEKDPNLAIHSLSWLPLFCLMLYDFCYGVAFGGIPFLLLSELFPLKVRAVANGMGALNHNVCFFIVVKVFPTLRAVSNYGLFWIYASVGFLSVLFIFRFIPETKGRSLEEIEGMWYKNKSKPADNSTEDEPAKMSSKL